MEFICGFDKNLRERNQLLFLLSLNTIEHYFKQQTNNVNRYNYDGGEVFVNTKFTAPYSLESRTQPWNEILQLEDSQANYESKYGETKEYESEYDSD